LAQTPDGAVEHDARVGQLLKKMDEKNLVQNTSVMGSTNS
jgi:hypothetical protein